MIQRLQSVFLLLASGSSFGMFGTDVADSTVAGAPGLFADGSYTLFDDPVLIGLFAVAGVLFLADVFLFRNRPLQMKLSLAGVLLAVAGVAYGAFRLFTSTPEAVLETVTPDLGVGLPVLAIIFGLMARSYIRADEKLVRSADRLR